MLSFEDLHAYRQTRLKSDARIWDTFAGQLIAKVARDHGLSIHRLINERDKGTPTATARMHLIRELHRNGYGMKQIGDIVDMQPETVSFAIKHPSIIKHTSDRACGQ